MRFKISVTGGDESLFTKTGLPISQGFTRIVIGERGPYVEFSHDQIHTESIAIPKNSLYRVSSDVVFYVEYRSLDEAFVKVYYQKKTVAYADYKIGMWYISPADLFLEEGTPVLAPIPTPLALFED